MSSKEPMEERKVPAGQIYDHQTIDRGGGGPSANFQPSVGTLDDLSKDGEEKAVIIDDGAKTGGNINIREGNEDIEKDQLFNQIDREFNQEVPKVTVAADKSQNLPQEDIEQMYASVIQHTHTTKEINENIQNLDNNATLRSQTVIDDVKAKVQNFAAQSVEDLDLRDASRDPRNNPQVIIESSIDQPHNLKGNQQLDSQFAKTSLGFAKNQGQLKNQFINRPGSNTSSRQRRPDNQPPSVYTSINKVPEIHQKKTMNKSPSKANVMPGLEKSLIPLSLVTRPVLQEHDNQQPQQRISLVETQQRNSRSNLDKIYNSKQQKSNKNGVSKLNAATPQPKILAESKEPADNFTDASKVKNIESKMNEQRASKQSPTPKNVVNAKNQRSPVNNARQAQHGSPTNRGARNLQHTQSKEEVPSKTKAQAQLVPRLQNTMSMPVNQVQSQASIDPVAPKKHGSEFFDKPPLKQPSHSKVDQEPKKDYGRKTSAKSNKKLIAQKHPAQLLSDVATGKVDQSAQEPPQVVNDKRSDSLLHQINNDSRNFKNGGSKEQHTSYSSGKQSMKRKTEKPYSQKSDDQRKSKTKNELAESQESIPREQKAVSHSPSVAQSHNQSTINANASLGSTRNAKEQIKSDVYGIKGGEPEELDDNEEKAEALRLTNQKSEANESYMMDRTSDNYDTSQLLLKSDNIKSDAHPPNLIQGLVGHGRDKGELEESQIQESQDLDEDEGGQDEEEENEEEDHDGEEYGEEGGNEGGGGAGENGQADKKGENEKLVSKLKKDYFQDRTVEFKKNQSYRQCVLNPFDESGQSVLTLQIARYFPEKRTKSSMFDDNSEQKPVISIENQGLIESYGTVKSYKDGSFIIESLFGDQENQNNVQSKPIVIDYGISRVVNKERGLVEAIFFSHDRQTPFMFSWITKDENNMRINFLKGISAIESITVDGPQAGKTISTLKEQIIEYKTNPKSDDDQVESCDRRSNKCTQAPPTLIQIDKVRYLVMSLTIGQGIKRSIGLFKVQENVQTCSGEPEFVIPGAESFLDYDHSTKTIHYLTTKKMADLKDTKTHVKDARSSSLSQVREISFVQLVKLNELIGQLGVYDISAIDLRGNETSNQIDKLMSELKTWNLEMDKQCLDFWRFSSTHFPYAEYWMKRNQYGQPEFLAVLCKDRDGEKNYLATMAMTISGQDEVMTPCKFVYNNKEAFCQLLPKEEDHPLDELRVILIKKESQSQNNNDQNKEQQKKEEQPIHVIKISNSQGNEKESWEQTLCSLPSSKRQFNIMSCKNNSLTIVFIESGNELKLDLSLDDKGSDSFKDDIPFSFEQNEDAVESSKKSNREHSVVMRGLIARTLHGNRLVVTYFSYRKPGKETSEEENKPIEDSHTYVFEQSQKQVMHIPKEVLSLTKDLILQVDSTFKEKMNDIFSFALVAAKQLPKLFKDAHVVSLNKENSKLYVLYGSLRMNQDSLSKSKLKQSLKLSALQVHELNQVAKRNDALNVESDQVFEVSAQQIIQQIGTVGNDKHEDGLIHTINFNSEKDFRLYSVSEEFKEQSNIQFFHFDLTKVRDKSGEVVLKEPSIQSATPQHFYFDYPVLAYKSSQSNDREIILCNFAIQHTPKRSLVLKEVQFICFVGVPTMEALHKLKDVENTWKQLTQAFVEKKLVSHILFLGRVKDKVRLYMIEVNPWRCKDSALLDGDDQDQVTAEKDFNFARVFKLDSVPAVDFTGIVSSDIKKAEMLIEQSKDDKENESLHMSIILQSSHSIKSISLTEGSSKPVTHFPASDLETVDKLIVRGQSVDNAVYCIAYNPEQQVYSVQCFYIDKIKKKGRVRVEQVLNYESQTILAFERDSERSRYFYCLDDELKLKRYQDTTKGFLELDRVYDLSVHDLDEAIQKSKKESRWSQIQIDSRQITLGDKAYSLMTDNSYDINEMNEDQENSQTEENQSAGQKTIDNSINNGDQKVEEEKSQMIKSQSQEKLVHYSDSVQSKQVDQKDQKQTVQEKPDTLIKQQSVLGTQLNLQLFKKEDGYFYFVVKPNPGSTVIDLLGNHRIDARCKYFFVRDKRLMAHSENWSKLPILGKKKKEYMHEPITFDQTGLVDQKQSYKDYENLQKVVTETAFKKNTKYLVIRNSKGFAIVTEQAGSSNSLRKSHTLLRETKANQQLSREEAEKTFYEALEKKLKKDIGLSPVQIKFHHRRTHLIRSEGKPLVIASCYVDSKQALNEIGKKAAENKRGTLEFNFGRRNAQPNSCKIFHEPQKNNDETNEEQDKLDLEVHQLEDAYFGFYTFREAVQILVIISDDVEQMNQIEIAEPEEGKEQNKVFQFALVNNFLTWINFNQKRFWWLKLPETKEKEEKEGVTWHNLQCRSFQIKNMLEVFQQQKDMRTDVMLSQNHNTEIVSSRLSLGERCSGDDEDLSLVQITANQNAAIIKITDDEASVVDLISNMNEFEFPHQFSSTGFNYHSDKRMMQFNTNGQLGFISSVQISSNTERNQIKVSKLYRAFSKVDLWQLEKIFSSKKDETKNKLESIEPLSALCRYEEMTFFSMFKNDGNVYQLFYNQMRSYHQQSENMVFLPDELALFKRRLRYILTLPTKVSPEIARQKTGVTSKRKQKPGDSVTEYQNIEKDLGGKASILKQCCLLNEQQIRVLIIRIADMIEEMTITDYVGNDSYISVLREKLPQAQFMKILNKSMTNIFTEQITEVVMDKRDSQATFLSYSPILKIQSSKRSKLSNYIEDTEFQTLRKVNVRLLPLNWVYATDGTYTELFNLFGKFNDKFYGSFLLDVMMSNFWEEIQLRIKTWCYRLYQFYFGVAQTYFFLMLYEADENAPYWGFDNADYVNAYEKPWWYVLLFLYVIQIIQEGSQAKELGLKYFYQPSNWIDLASYILNFFTLLFRRLIGENEDLNLEIARLRILGAFAALLMWIQLCFWLRLKDGYAKYLELIVNTMYDAANFIVIIVYIILGCGVAFYLLQIERIYRGAKDEDDLLYPFDPSNFSFTEAITHQYFILLGDFGAIQLEDRLSKGNEVAAKLLFLITTFLTQILILNMLIALMSQTFSEYIEREDEYEIKSKLKMITDYIYWADLYSYLFCCRCIRKKQSKKKKQYVVVITRVVDDEDEDDAIDGENQLNMIKRTIDNRFRSLENLLTKRISKALAIHSVDTKVKLNSLETQGKQNQNESKLQIQELKKALMKKIDQQTDHIEDDQSEDAHQVQDKQDELQEQVNKMEGTLVEITAAIKQISTSQNEQRKNQAETEAYFKRYNEQYNRKRP